MTSRPANLLETAWPWRSLSRDPPDRGPGDKGLQSSMAFARAGGAGLVLSPCRGRGFRVTGDLQRHRGHSLFQ